MPIEMTAAGIDADTVMPTRRPKYAFAPPNTIANNTPNTIEVPVNSGIVLFAGINGLKSLFEFIELFSFTVFKNILTNP